MRSSTTRKIQLLLAFATLLMVAFAAGCRGFFVNPTLTGITVGPTATIQQAKTVQMHATGAYDDGSSKPLGKGVFWSSATESVATVDSTTGIVTGVSPGTSVITGALGSVSGTATITVTLANITAIKVTSTDTSVQYGTPEQFKATATANGQQVDVTNSVTWTTNPTSITDVSIDSTTGLLTTTSGPTNPVTFFVIATDPASGISGQESFTVNPGP
jgi:trimeric autotransporter adhesin